MKRVICGISALAMMLSLLSCGDEAKKNEENTTGETVITTAVTEKNMEEELGIDIVSDVVSLTKMGAPGLGQFSAHGGHQTRIVKTSHGVYCAYLTGEEEVVDNFTYYKYSLNKIDAADGKVTVLHEGKLMGASNSCYIMADKNENIWVVSGHETYSARGFGLQNNLMKYDPATGEVTEFTKSFAAKNDPDLRGYGYVMSFIDNYTDSIYIIHCAGDKDGLFVIFRFDINTEKFIGKGTSFTLPGRHCYLYGFADGEGGFSIAGQRDMSIEATGFEDYFKNGDYWATYVWDDIRLFSFDVTEENEIVSTGVHEVDVADYVKESGLYPQNIHYRNGDVYRDGEGNTHFFYRSAYDNGVAQIVTRHTVMNKDYDITYTGEIVLDPKYHSYELKLYQTADDVFYMVAFPKYLALPEGEIPVGNPESVGQRIHETGDAVIQIYRSEDGMNYTMIHEEALTGQKWTPSHITATQSRNGSLIDSKLSLMIHTGDDWRYVTVDLDAAEKMYEYSK